MSKNVKFAFNFFAFFFLICYTLLHACEIWYAIRANKSKRVQINITPFYFSTWMHKSYLVKNALVTVV